MRRALRPRLAHATGANRGAFCITCALATIYDDYAPPHNLLAIERYAGAPAARIVSRRKASRGALSPRRNPARPITNPSDGHGARALAKKFVASYAKPARCRTTNEIQAMIAAIGMVSTHAPTMFVAIPHRTAFTRLMLPTPTIAPAIACVVETGSPK
jgi:hypothetical protein